jgi:hypothetical protein
MTETAFHSLTVEDAPPLEIAKITRQGDQVTLPIVDRAQGGYTSEYASVIHGVWRPAVTAHSGSQWTLTVPPTVRQVFWRIHR